MCYKAIEKYYNADGKQIEHLCGFGYCKDLEEARQTYRAGIHIYEISETELKELQEAVKKMQFQIHK